jgi:predicted RNase H-like nuclease (RuvC/YqgF family)
MGKKIPRDLLSEARKNDYTEWKDKVDKKHKGQTGFFMEIGFDENEVQAAVNCILDLEDPSYQNSFWMVVKERLINHRNTEIEELNENIEKERERIQRLKESLKDLL